MITTWFEERDFWTQAVQELSAQRSLESAWGNIRGDVAMKIVASLPSLSARCRWVSAELARKFAIRALDVAHVTGPAVDALRTCAPVVDAETAHATAKAAIEAKRVAAHAARRHDCSPEAFYAAAAADAARFAADASFNTPDSNASAHAAFSAADAASGAGDDEDRHLGLLVRAAIPWEWVREAAAVDAPELLEVAGP